jgi:hypothetical protein
LLSGQAKAPSNFWHPEIFGIGLLAVVRPMIAGARSAAAMSLHVTSIADVLDPQYMFGTGDSPIFDSIVGDCT